jgi:acetolactate synthase-1/2/3 large subunit
MMDRPSVNVFPRGGGIGQGLAMAVGAAVARPERPTLALVGDGGLAVHLGELLTVAQERPWLIVLVFDDGGYGVLRNTQDAFVGRRTGVDLATPDFVTLAASMDIPAWSVGNAFEFERAFSEAVAVRGPALVRVDVPAMGDLPRPFTPPVSIPGRG